MAKLPARSRPLLSRHQPKAEMPGCPNCRCDQCRSADIERAATNLARHLLDPDREPDPGTMAEDLANDPRLWRDLSRLSLPDTL